jgi:hypothetical protein
MRAGLELEPRLAGLGTEAPPEHPAPPRICWSFPMAYAAAGARPRIERLEREAIDAWPA